MPDINIDNVEYTIEINPIPTYEINLNAQGPQGLTGPQGEQGQQGEQGVAGQDGVSPSVSVTTTTAGATVTITDADGSHSFDILNGQDGQNGQDGTNATITGVSASISGTTGTPSVSVTMGGTESARTFDFAFSNLKGDKGDTGSTGATGTSAQIVGASASVTNTIGTPSVTVINGGTSTERTFDFQFSNLKGDKGDTGNTGATGNGIADISKTSSSGLVDTYTITYTNGNSDVFDVTNGEDGTDGVSVTSVTLESTVGLAVNYRMHFSNGDYYDYTVMNGASGSTEWGGISGTLSNQSDLQNALNGKQNTLTPGSNIQINGNTISATDTVYTLPVATTSTLGGVIVGNNLTIGADGTLDALGTSYSQGSGIEISGNTISVSTTIASKTDIGNGVLTVQRNGSAIGSFSANATSASTINISVPTTATEVGALPSDTVIGDGKVIFKKNGTALNTVSANQTSTTTIDYTIPTQASDIGALPDTTTIGSGNTTITVNGTVAGTINANATSNSSIDITTGSGLPSQTGHAGGLLTTDGTNASWGATAEFVAITAYGRNGTAWYIEFSNGEIWQGDVTPSGVSSYDVTLPFEMDISDGLYNIDIETYYNGADTGGFTSVNGVVNYPTGITSTGFTISLGTTYYAGWTVRGKKKVS